jgi:glutaredoxin
MQDKWEKDFVESESTDEIILFTQYNCKRCRPVKELMDEAGIDYREANVQTAEGCIDWCMYGRGITHTPLLYWKGELISDFDDILKRIYEYKKEAKHETA